MSKESCCENPDIMLAIGNGETRIAVQKKIKHNPFNVAGDTDFYFCGNCGKIKGDFPIEFEE